MTGTASSAGRWTMLLLVYMLLLYGIFYVTAQAMASHNSSSATISGLDALIAQQQQIQTGGVCQAPRNEDESTTSYIFDRASLSCTGIPSAGQDVCTSIDGCAWVNETYWQFQWAFPPFTLASTGNQSCQGNVSIAWLLDNESSVSVIDDGTRSVLEVDAADISTYQTFVSGTLPYIYATSYRDTSSNITYNVTSPLTQPSQLILDVCDMPALQSASVCSQFGCTWKTIEQIKGDAGTPKFGDVISFMFGFDMDLGNAPQQLNMWVSLFLVWLPLTMLVIAFITWIKGF